MDESNEWLTRFEQIHNDINNTAVYWMAVFMVVVSTTGLLWHLPAPPEFHEISPLLNWGSTFLMATAIYYFIISLSLAIGMLPFLMGLAAIQLWLADSGYPELRVCGGLLIAGMFGLWFGRRGPGNVRAVLQDLQLLMIGPVWLLSVIYRRLGIPV